MTRTLPDFENPPVVEVILGVQFKPINGLRAFNVAHLLDIYHGDFSQLEEKEPLDPVQEKLSREPASQSLVFSIQTVPPLPRFWLKDEADNHLLQIQRNRFLRNWKSFEKDNKAEYPRYPNLKDSFKRDFDKFSQFISDNEMGSIHLEYAEISYVNYIWAPHNYSNPILKPFALNYSTGNIPELEEADLTLRYLLPDESGKPIGRMHIRFEPRFKNKQEIYQLMLTVRGEPAENSIDSVLKFMDAGHEAIVQGFEAVTNESWHKTWGKK
jgi:uncharacterized protein (TIGR04255 family)